MTKSVSDMLDFLGQLAASDTSLSSYRKYIGNSEAVSSFLKLLAEVLEDEYESFFEKHWVEYKTRCENDGLPSRIAVQWLKQSDNILNYTAEVLNKDIHVYLSPGLSNFGRGYRSAEGISVAVGLPTDKTDTSSKYLMLLHELAHMMTDSLIPKEFLKLENLREDAAEYLGHRYLDSYEEPLAPEYRERFINSEKLILDDGPEIKGIKKRIDLMFDQAALN